MHITINGADTEKKRNACYSSIEDFVRADAVPNVNITEMEYHYSEETYGLECLVTLQKVPDGLKCDIVVEGGK